MSRRIFVHVGTPKSGTTYLQAVLWHNAAALRADGLLLPARFQAHYAAAKGVTSRRGMHREVKIDMDTAWSRLARQVNRWPSDALISHELLSPATAQQAQHALAEVRGEVHIVLTARALHKQVPASWQEQVKGGLPTPYDVFLSRVRSDQAKGAWFWQVQDVADIASRWGAHLPPQRIHVVTVPADSADPSLLWSRYAATLGLDGSAYDLTVPRKNTSLGVVESELLRRVHAVRDYRFTDGNRHPWTRKLLATEVLGQRIGAPIRTPPQACDWLERRSVEMLDSLQTRGYEVHGALEDLSWQPAAADARLLSSVTEAELSEATLWTVHQLHRVLAHRHPGLTPPDVGPEDGVAGILDLLECIRGGDSGAPSRAAAGQAVASREPRESRIARLPPAAGSATERHGDRRSDRPR